MPEACDPAGPMRDFGRGPRRYGWQGAQSPANFWKAYGLPPEVTTRRTRLLQWARRLPVCLHLNVRGGAPLNTIVRCFRITDQTVWKEKLFLWFGFEFMMNKKALFVGRSFLAVAITVIILHNRAAIRALPIL